MSINTIAQDLDRVRRLVYRGCYSKAIAYLEKSYPQCEGRLRGIAESHRYLCQYYMQGVEDPQRQTIRLKNGRDLLALIDDLHYKALVSTEGSSPFVSTLHHLEQKGQRSIPLLLKELGAYPSEGFFERLDLLMNRVWSTYPLDGESKEALLYTLSDEEQVPLLAQAIIGMLFLSLMEVFDESKVDLLISLATHLDLSVRIRALIALLFLGLRHGERLAFHQELLSRGRAVMVSVDSEEMYQLLGSIYTSYTTESDNKYYVEKILPSINDAMSKIQMQMNPSEFISKLNSGEGSEELRELERVVSGLGEEMPKDRDLHYHSMKDMKVNTFFYELPHWFLPFVSDHPAINGEAREAFEKFLPLLTQNGMICSSDLYSYALLQYWSMMLGMMNNQLPDMKGHLPVKDVTYFAKDFVFDLYRFYTISSFRTSFTSPFEPVLSLDACAFISESGIVPTEVWGRVAMRLLSLRLYDLSKVLLERLLREVDSPQPKYLKAYAMVLAKSGDKSQAIEYLRRATEIEGVIDVVALRIADLYRDLGDNEAAEQWYRSADEVSEKSYQAAYRLATLLISQNRFTEAEAPLFKALFISEEKDRAVIISLAHVLFRVGKAQEALQRLFALANGALSLSESLFKAVLYLAVGERTEAMTLLRKWSQEGGEEISLSNFLKVAEGLSNYGIELWEQRLIYDVISVSDTSMIPTNKPE